MPAHLPARLTWRQDGWNGRVCNHAMRNSACMVHNQVRNSRNDMIEITHPGQPGGGLNCYWLDFGTVLEVAYRGILAVTF
jgi:hypothetical protein